MTQPDPDPATTPGLEPGGGVRPGDTPPAEAGTAGLSATQEPPRAGVNKVVLVGLGGLVLVIVVVLIIGAVGSWG